MSQRQRAGEAKRRKARDTRVVIGYIHPGEVAGDFMESVCGTMMIEARPDGLLGPGGGTINIRSGPRIAEGRSQVVETFINTEMFKPADWLMMIDADMVFPPEAIRRLVEVADPEERPIVGGLCYAGSSPENCYPTMFRLVEEDGKWATEPTTEFPFDAVVKVGGTGAAFMLVHRSVLWNMYQAFQFMPDGVTPNCYPWFVEGHQDIHGRPLGEDIAFCIRAQSMGYPIHVHTGVEVGHRKSVILDTKTWKENRP